MELTRENLEKTLKIHMDKMKFKLCLNSYSNSDYVVRLVDHIGSDMVISKGDTILIQVQTDRFTEAIGEPKKYMDELNRLLESGLRLVPKMFESLSHSPIADKLAFNKKTRKFKRYSISTFAEAFPPHPYEKEVNFSIDFRATGIHWKSGTIVREHGKSAEAAMGATRARIFGLLADETTYKRDENSFVRYEEHNDVVFDIVAECKILTREEIETLIRKLEEEYLSGK